MKSIPVTAARKIAEQFGYDQVIVIARKVGDDGREHCTTYGVDLDNCRVAAQIGEYLKIKVMHWKPRKCIVCGHSEYATDAHFGISHPPFYSAHKFVASRLAEEEGR